MACASPADPQRQWIVSFSHDLVLTPHKSLQDIAFDAQYLRAVCQNSCPFWQLVPRPQKTIHVLRRTAADAVDPVARAQIQTEMNMQ